MLQLLSKLTGYDSDPEYFSSSEIFKEANRKFSNTYLIINDNLEWIESFSFDGITVYGENYSTITDVSSIKTWMPEPGCYKLDENLLIYLFRKPRRQWLKSFSLGNNYDTMTVYSKTHQDIKHAQIKEIYKDWKNNQVVDRNWVVHKAYLIYKFHVVGKWSDTVIQVLDKNFYQEVVDKWGKHFNIVLVKNSLDHTAEGNLNTPNW